MSAQVNGSDGRPAGAPQSPAALEQAIQERRDRLAATIDELTTRAKPRELARRGASGVQRRFTAATHGPAGELRTERLAAVGGALAVLGALLILLRRRR